MTAERVGQGDEGPPRLGLARAYLQCARVERIVWARTAVIAGSFAEESAVFVSAGGEVPPEQVPAALARLAAYGVLTREDGAADGSRAVRYRMGREAREFGGSRLRYAGESGIAMERFVIHCRYLAAVAEHLWSTGCRPQAVGLVREELENLTAAMAQGRRDPEHAPAALEAAVSLWFWWVAQDDADAGLRELLPLLRAAPADGSVPAHAHYLAAWLMAGSDPEAAGRLLATAWPQAVLDGDAATAGRIAQVQGMLALHRGDEAGAAGEFALASELIPPHALGGPSRAVSLAALAFALAGSAPAAARRAAHRALTAADTVDDAWGRCLARLSLAYVDHRQGRSSRAWRRVRRVLAEAGGSVPPPWGAEFARRLIADIEQGRRRALDWSVLMTGTGSRRRAGWAETGSAALSDTASVRA
ncbi:hypothetical protein [Streptomyces boninensis]|uniref:hypothetical protein n=1 Tax=Streptomyces boninensis TaxID=2039455 RepID=UPI003B212BFA